MVEYTYTSNTVFINILVVVYHNDTCVTMLYDTCVTMLYILA